MSIEKREMPSQAELDDRVRSILHRQSRRSFLIGGAAALAGAGLFDLLYKAHQVNGLQWPLRSVEETNRSITNAIFRQQVLAPTYRLNQVTGLRINGDFGLDLKLIQSTWGLQVVGLNRPQQYPQYMNDVDLWDYRSSDDYSAQVAKSEPDVKGNGKAAVADPYAKHAASGPGATPGIVLRIDDLRRLPYVEQITQFKCVEGWSQIVRWGGVRFSDFMRAYPPADIDGAPPRFAEMETEDGSFNASFDMPSLLHPQTLLCYTIDGRPLEPAHGAPLRLAMPLKYGYKQIKQIATITYGNKRTPDYWEKLGYDWYAGL
jgi:hypothetical protein